MNLCNGSVSRVREKRKQWKNFSFEICFQRTKRVSSGWSIKIEFKWCNLPFILSGLFCDSLSSLPFFFLSTFFYPRQQFSAIHNTHLHVLFHSCFQGKKISDFSLLESSLDMDIGDLADAAFNLLRVQEWFDAILILDDSSTSDRLRFRLANLCKSSSSTSNPSQSLELGGSRSHLKPGSSVWNRLMTVQVSNSLLQNEVRVKTHFS